MEEDREPRCATPWDREENLNLSKRCDERFKAEGYLTSHLRVCGTQDTRYETTVTTTPYP